MVTRFALSLAACCAFALSAQAQVRVDSLGDPLSDGAVARLGTLRLKHNPGLTSQIYNALFSPDGKKLWSLGSEGHGISGVHHWDVATGKDLDGPWNSNPDIWLTAVAYAPDGTTVAVARWLFNKLPALGYETDIVIWDTAAGKALQSLTGNRNVFRSLAFTDAGKTLLAVENKNVRWFDVAGGKETRIWQVPETTIKNAKEPKSGGDRSGDFDMVLSPDAKLLAVQIRGPLMFNKDKQVMPLDYETVVYELASGKVQWRVQNQFKDAAAIRNNGQMRMVVSADSKWAALSLGDGKVEVRNTVTGKLVATAGNSIVGLALSSDGSILAVAANSKVALYNAKNGELLRQLPTRRPQPVFFATRFLAFSPDDKLLLVCADADLQLYTVATFMEMHRWDGHRGPVDSVAFSKDGKKILTGITQPDMEPIELLTWDAATWKQLQISSTQKPQWPNLGVASPEHSFFVGKPPDDCFNLYDMGNGKLLGRFSEPKNQPPGDRCYFSPGSKFFVLFGRNEAGKRIERLYAVPSCKLLCQLPSVSYDYDINRPITFSSDDRLVALVGRKDGVISILDTATGKLVRRLGTKIAIEDEDDFDFCLGTLKFSPDGRFLAAWNTLDELVRVWDVATGKIGLQLLPAQVGNGQFFRGQFPNGAMRFGWSPDGRMLAIANFHAKGKIQLWEVATGNLRREIAGHQGYILDLAFSPDGRFLASASSDTTVLIWDVWGQSKN